MGKGDRRNSQREFLLTALNARTAVLIALTAVFNAYINNFKFNRRKMFYSDASFMGGNGPMAKIHSNEGNAYNRNRVGDSGDELSGNRAFDHPALWRRQKPIWLSQDTLVC